MEEQRQHYTPLLKETTTSDSGHFEPQHVCQRWRFSQWERYRQGCWSCSWQKLLYLTFLTFSWLLTLGLSLYVLRTRSWGHDRFNQQRLMPAQLTYSPAQDDIEYEVRVFERDLEEAPERFRNPETVDEAWKDLHEVGMSAISEDEASWLTNHTTKAMYGQSEYAVQLAVFHQLHCLDIIRQTLDPYDGSQNQSLSSVGKQHRTQRDSDVSRKPHSFYMTPPHLHHCINLLRNSIMCHSDISTIVLQWDESKARNMAVGNVAHTCRNFERIHDWARSRRTMESLDHFTKPDEDDIIIPTWP